MAPMIVMTSETTVAKIGRSMKKRLILMGFAFPTRGARCRPASFLRLGDRRLGQRLREGQGLAPGGHPSAGPGALQAPDDHPIHGRDTLAHHAHAFVER